MIFVPSTPRQSQIAKTLAESALMDGNLDAVKFLLADLHNTPACLGRQLQIKLRHQGFSAAPH